MVAEHNCLDINRYKIDEFRKHAKIVFYLTSRDAKTVRCTSWEQKFKSYDSNSGFHDFGDIDLDLCSSFCHKFLSQVLESPCQVS